MSGEIGHSARKIAYFRYELKNRHFASLQGCHLRSLRSLRKAEGFSGPIYVGLPNLPPRVVLQRAIEADRCSIADLGSSG